MNGIHDHQLPGSTETPEPEQTDDWFPWPPRAGRSPLDALLRTWKLSVFQPTRFFRAMPVPAPIGPAVLYYLIVGIPALGISLFWQMLFETIYTTAGSGSAPRESTLGTWLPLLQFLLSPIFLLLGLGISFVIHHATLAILGGARRGPGTTLRTLCFAYSPVIFAAVPFIGAAVGGVWMIVLAIIGLRETHQTDGWRAATAILLPVAVIIFLGIVAAVLVGVLAAYLTA